MPYRLHMLDSYPAVDGSGRSHTVRAYEHQVELERLTTDGRSHWEPTGEVEYRLEGGEVLEPQADGSWRGRTTALHVRPA